MKPLVNGLKKFAVISGAILLTGCQSLWSTQDTMSFTQIRQSVRLVTNSFGSCSAVMIAPKLALTAKHCVGDNLKVDGQSAIVIAESPQDSVLLLVNLDCPCTPLGANLVTGAPVYIVGYPLGLAQILVKGHFESVLQGKEPDFEGYLVFSAAVEGGFSGGGIFQYAHGQWYLVSTVSAGSRTILLAPSDLADE